MPHVDASRTSRPSAPWPLAAALVVALLASDASAQRSPHRALPAPRLDVTTTVAPEARVVRRDDLRAGAGSRPVVMLTGYWPPSNEMIRHFATDPFQNPGGWAGEDWEGRGYDIKAFFPEFVPGCLTCLQGMGKLEVDYQDTSDDFWAIADFERPVAIITFSRGLNDMSWEVELNQYNKDQWGPDYSVPKLPTPNPPDASVPVDFLRPSNLPMQGIVDAVDALGFNLDPYICISGDGGGFLSEFIAYHGTWYRDLHDQPSDPAWTIAAGHVHVGGKILVGRARLAAEATLRAVLDHLDTVIPPVTCQADLGFGGPGASALSLCGEPLATGGTADLVLTGAPPSTTAFLVAGLDGTPTPFAGGQLVPLPALKVLAFPTDATGSLTVPAIGGGGGPVAFYLQAVVADGGQPFGFGLSNALQVQLLP